MAKGECFLKVLDIYNLLNQMAPTNAALSYDNVGLLVGDQQNQVTKAVVTLDCTPAAVDYAIGQSAELIISHHPVIFDPLKSVTNQKGKVVYSCLKNNISVISMHTNLDVADGGVNDCLAAALGLFDVTSVIDEEGFSFRKGNLKKTMTADQLAKHIKNTLGGNVRYTDGGKKITTVAVCGGSGGSELVLAMENADAFITADVKHNLFISAAENEYSLFDAGHFHTENVVVIPLAERLGKSLTQVEFLPFNGEEIKTV